MKLTLTIIQIILSMIGGITFIGICYAAYLAFMRTGLNNNAAILLPAFMGFTTLFYFILEFSIEKPK